MVSFRLGFNPGDTVTVVDGAGRTIGGHEYGPVAVGTDIVDAALADGRIVLVPGDPQPSDSQEAREARGRVDELEARRAQAAEMTPSMIRERLARFPAMLPPGTAETATPSELAVLAAVVPMVDVTPPRKPTRSAKSTEKE